MSDDAKSTNRTETTVLGPDDPNQKPLGFSVSERLGCNVYRLNEGSTSVVEVPLTNKDDLVEGMTLGVPALMGGYHVMKVKKDEYGEMHAQDDKLLAVLKFGEDDRHAWICVGLINTRGLKNLRLQK